MNNTEVFVLVQWVTLVGVAVGLGASWGSIKTEIKHIKDALNDKHSGLGAIKESIDEQKLTCGKSMAEMNGRIKLLEHDKNKPG